LGLWVIKLLRKRKRLAVKYWISIWVFVSEFKLKTLS
jgi:hypothetical protein